MNYSETVDWIYDQLPAYQNIGNKAYKANLNNITALCNALGNPQNQFKSVHVAGTNGKGSTCHLSAAALQSSDYKTGLYTSPHLIDFRERTRINGEMISKEFVVRFIQQNKDTILNLNASFFEISVAMSFQYFAENKVDIAIIETGLGGRLDSTNIINPEVACITNIGLDHTNILGDSIEQIAKEKAGIIKENTPIVIGESDPKTDAIFISAAKQKNAPICFADIMKLPHFSTNLKGRYQDKNVKTATAVLTILKELGWNKLTEKTIQYGFNHVSQLTGLRGRWEVFQTKPLIIADTAHNPAGIKEVVQQIKETPHEKLHLILGFVNDKDTDKIVSLFPKNAEFYFTEPTIFRKKPISELKKKYGTQSNIHYYDSVQKAIKQALKNSNPNDLIYIGGSTFVVADALPYFDKD